MTLFTGDVTKRHAMAIVAGILTQAVFGNGQYQPGVGLEDLEATFESLVRILIDRDPLITSLGIIEHPLGGFAIRVTRNPDRHPFYTPESTCVEGVPILYQYEYEVAKPLTRANGRGGKPPVPRGSNPLTSGHDIRNIAAEERDYGSISFFVPHPQGAPHPDFLFSNNHVLRGQCRAFRTGEEVIHPFQSSTVVGQLHSVVDLKSVSNGTSIRDAPLNSVDVGVALVDAGTPTAHVITFSKSAPRVQPQEQVKILGAINKPKSVKVKATNEVVPVEYDFKTCWFKDVIRLPPVAEPGDSGAAIVRASNNELVGIVFAGNSMWTYGYPISSLHEHWENLIQGGIW